MVVLLLLSRGFPVSRCGHTARIQHFRREIRAFPVGQLIVIFVGDAIFIEVASLRYRSLRAVGNIFSIAIFLFRAWLLLLHLFPELR